jgi:putative hydrolase of the HAD superfamily
MLRLYIFDEGGVVCRNPEMGALMAARLGISLEDWRRFALPDLQAFMRGELDASAYWGRFSERSGLEIREDYWATLFSPTLDLPTDGLIRDLGKAARVVCGTNTMAAHYAAHVALGQYGAFHRVYASHLMGRAKPEAAFFQAILEAEGVAPGEAFFTDDLPLNVEAAAALGIEARLYTDAERLRQDLLSLGAPVGVAPPGTAAFPCEENA